MKEKILAAVESVFPKMVEIRRHIHQFPELSGQEINTADYIAAFLNECNIPFIRNVGGHGIVAIIFGNNPSSVVAGLRADMDALPIQELNDVPYKSQFPNIMHACGHDAHTAALMGTLLVLNSLKNEFSGTVKFIFQPSEEKFPGGAKLMIEDGALDNPKVDFMLGAHVLPTMNVGFAGVKAGMYMASTDEIYLAVKGKGGHAATPELLNDPVAATVEIISALQQIVSRKNNPVIPSVLSFGRIIADGRTNIIPDEVLVEGTFRTFNELWRHQAHSHIKNIAEGVANSLGTTCHVNIAHGYPFLINNEELTSVFKSSGLDLLGDNFIDIPLRMTAEDFAYYSHIVPSVFFRFGVANNENGIQSNLHTATFDIDENALKTAASLMSLGAIDLMSYVSKNR